MNQSNSSTTAFYTLDGCVSDNLDETFQALLEVRKGNSQLWKELVKRDGIASRLHAQGLDNMEDRLQIPWDDGMGCQYNLHYSKRYFHPIRMLSFLLLLNPFFCQSKWRKDSPA